MLKFVAIFSALGLFVPVFFTITWSIIERFTQYSVKIGSDFVVIQILCWPSSIFMMATTGSRGSDIKMFSISAMVNVLIYTIVGFLIWYGLINNDWFYM